MSNRTGNLTNYHSHSLYCDGRANMEDFIRFALSEGFTSYGFSSHAPLPFSTAWTMEWDSMDDYLAEFHRLKAKYAGQIELYIGLEIDYLNEESNPSVARFRELPLDYRIGSVHLVTEEQTGEIMDMDGKFEDFRENLRMVFRDDLKYLVEAYFKASSRMVELGGFDFVAHLDKISMNGSLMDSTLTKQEWYNRLLWDYMSLIAERGVMVEVNTKAYTKKGMMFPNVKYFKWLKELNIPVMVNSDAHLPQLVNDNRALAFEWLREVGIKSTMRLHQGAWVEVPIDNK